MYSFSYSDLRGGRDFEPRVSAQPERDASNPAYYQVWLDRKMSVCIALSDAQCRELMDALGSRPQLPKSDAQIDAELEESRGDLPPYQHQERNGAIAEPLRGILNAISPEDPNAR